MTERLLLAALDYAQAQRAEVVEAYPLRTETTKLLPCERYMSSQSTFERMWGSRLWRRSRGAGR